MMRISGQGIALIKRFEGFCPAPYICPAGLPTIGYGHVIGAGERFPAGKISQKDAEILLKQDVSKAEQAVNRFVTISLTQNQFDALVSLAYNIGVKAFEKSTLLRILNQKQPEKAALEFPKWIYANGRKLPGLADRRKTEAILFLNKTDFTEL